MGEHSAMARIFVGLGIIMLLVGLLYPGADAPWLSFQATLEGTTFPEFFNPFEPTGVITLLPSGDIPANSPDSATDAGGDVNDCENDTSPYWGCLRTLDGNESFVTDNDEFQVNLTAINSSPGSLPIFELRSRFQVRATTPSTTRFTISMFTEPGHTLFYSETDQPIVETGEFQLVTIVNAFDTPYPVVSVASPTSSISIQTIGGTEIEVSFVAVDVVHGANVDCTSADTLAYIGCIIGSFFNSIVRFLGLVVGAGIFVGSWLFAAGTIAGAFLAAIAGSYAFLFALPGAPPIVQGIIDVIVVAETAMVLFILVRTVRG